jgi:pyroglutamyl-peptidase
VGRILVTGFGPFGPNGENPTALLMDRLAGRDGIVTAVLPVEYRTSILRFEALLTEHRPDAAIAFGLAAKSDRILIERVALNLDDAILPDNAGLLRQGERIAGDGPVGYWSTLPVDRLIAALQSAGLPASGSGHAGGYVCNHLFYGVRHGLECAGSAMPMGLIHVPPLPCLDLDALERAALIILKEVAVSMPGPPSFNPRGRHG